MIYEKEKIEINNLDFEAIISSISSRFVGKISFDGAVNSSLRDIGKLSGAKCTFLFLFNQDKTLMRNSHKWCSENSSQNNDSLVLKTSVFPWWMEQLNKSRLIQINDITTLPNKAQSTKELLMIQKIKAILVLPLYVNSDLAGFIGFGESHKKEKWNEINISLLKILSQIIGMALERNYIEKMLKNSENKYKLIIENINDLVFIIDLKFRVEYVNQKIVSSILGYEIDDFLGISCLDFIYPEDIEQVVNELQNKKMHEEIKTELRIRHKDGYWVWFEWRGHIIIDRDERKKWFIIARDISNRKFTEEKYKNLFENSPNAILLIDFNGKIIDCNFTATKLFGNHKNFFIGKSLSELDKIFISEIKPYFKKIFQAFFKGDFPDPIEIEIKDKDQNSSWVEIQASVVKQESLTIIQLIFKDISEKKKAELLEKKFKEELEKEVQIRTRELRESFDQQKLYLDQILKTSQFKTEFMSTMSHELRTPLNAIIGFTDLLVEGVYGPFNTEQKEILDDIRSSAQHQFDMIKNILDISKIESGQITLNIMKISVNSIVDQIISSLKPLYHKKDLDIKVKSLEKEVFIYADPIRFKEILLNLLTNAIKFTIEGYVVLKVEDRYKEWLFKVTDTGIGIAVKDFPLIFKDFKRIDSTYVRSVSGTGLGLSLTKRLVELHGGEINFTSLLGSGSIFSFTISKELEERISSKS
ncbi:MAG: PAS domain S-box protein [Candidatus Odinarchaeota archaeon]